MKRIEVNIETGEVTEIALTQGEVDAIQSPPIIVPASLTMAQARLALLEFGYLDTVLAAVSQMPRAAQIKFEFAGAVERSDSLTQAMVALLGLTETQTDELFIFGSTQ